MTSEVPEARPRSVRGLVTAFVLGVVLLLAVLAAAAWWWMGRPDPTPWDRVTIDGQQVVVEYAGSGCEDAARLEIEEKAHEIVVTVRSGSHSLSCEDVAVPRRLTGRLREPVGTRTVVDGACRIAGSSSRLACGHK